MDVAGGLKAWGPRGLGDIAWSVNLPHFAVGIAVIGFHTPMPRCGF